VFRTEGAATNQRSAALGGTISPPWKGTRINAHTNTFQGKKKNLDVRFWFASNGLEIGKPAARNGSTGAVISCGRRVR
jgi:hypothetical protein